MNFNFGGKTMKDIKVTDSVKYIGVDDHDIDLFESQYVVPMVFLITLM